MNRYFSFYYKEKNYKINKGKEKNYFIVVS